jgi:hypothetical protein
MKWSLLVFVLLLALAGCGPSVVGKWDYSVFGQNVTLDLKDDNTFTMGAGGTNTQAGTYTFEDGKVNLKFGQSASENMVLSLSESGKTLSGSVGIANIELTRREE